MNVDALITHRFHFDTHRIGDLPIAG